MFVKGGVRVSRCFSTCDDFLEVHIVAALAETSCSVWQHKLIQPAKQLISTIDSQVINMTVATEVRLLLTHSSE